MGNKSHSASKAFPRKGVLAVLREAAKNGDAKIVQSLSSALRNKSRDSFGDTALILAAKSGSLACVKILSILSDTKAFNLRGETALIWASAAGHAGICALLANPETCQQADNDGNTALISAAIGGHAECVEHLAPLSNPDARLKRNGFNALMAASSNNHRECADMLALISNIHSVDSFGQTAADLARSGGFSDLSFRLDDQALAAAQSKAVEKAIGSDAPSQETTGRL